MPEYTLTPRPNRMVRISLGEFHRDIEDDGLWYIMNDLQQQAAQEEIGREMENE